RAASRVIERCGSASIRVGRRPRKCQCTARQLASVLLPLPPFIVATVMIMCRTPRSCDKPAPSESARGTVSDSPQTAYRRRIGLPPSARRVGGESGERANREGDGGAPGGFK